MVPPPSQKISPRRWTRWLAWSAGSYIALAGLLMVSLENSGCQPRAKTDSTAQPPPDAIAGATSPGASGVPKDHARLRSESCRACHAEVFDAWASSDHAHANRMVDPAIDQPAFTNHPDVTDEYGVTRGFQWVDGHPVLTEKRPDGAEVSYRADMVLAYSPLRQYLVPDAKGFWQASEMAWDPDNKEWFNVFGDDNRRPGEWGHWTGRGMNWNSMCAHCHMTGFEKNYDAKTDTYASTWVEQGISCVQCHGDMPGHETNPTLVTAELEKLHNRQVSMESCATCHSRAEIITAGFKPGDTYADFRRLSLPVEHNIYYPDGQVQDEDFVWGSFARSRMAHAGVTCFDCHDPHTNKTIFPAADNNLCMQCHDTGRLNAPKIVPTAHSFHSAETAGNSCVECHMPHTTYMQRDARRDHGFTSPDPLLTKELGIPNSCNRCHADQTVDWAIDWTQKWYGERLDNRQRQRARAVAAARATQPDGAKLLMDVYADEDLPDWQATLLDLARPYGASDPRVQPAATTALEAADPELRAAAVRVLSDTPDSHDAIHAKLSDPSKLVRMDAAWALASELPPDSTTRQEFEDYLKLNLDQPSGQLRWGQYLFNLGNPAAAEAPIRQATEWDPYSAGFRESLGFVLNHLDRPAEAAPAFWRAAQLDPNNSQSPYYAALAFAAADRLDNAEFALREAVKREPGFDRAWYNLGLLLAQSEKLPEAAEALSRAAQLAPQVPDYPYALATVYARSGQTNEAREAAIQALTADRNYTPALQLIQRLGPPR